MPDRTPSATKEGTMTVGRYDDNTWAVYSDEGKVLASGFFTSQDAHDWSSAAQGHEWGPWVSDPEAFNGDPNRICSCGLIQWLGNDDPHTRPHDV